MNQLIAILIYGLVISASSVEAEPNKNMPEVEIHSTGEISHDAPSRDNPVNSDWNNPDEIQLDEEISEPPITIETLSSTKSRVVTRTTPRPSNRNNQSGGVDIGPIYYPIGNNNNGQPSGSSVILNPHQQGR